MSKRSDYPRRKNDFYRTFDPRAVRALLPHIHRGTRFIEPCAGAGDLVDALVLAGNCCLVAIDIEPQRKDIFKGDAMEIRAFTDAVFITNPPWTRELLHPLIVHLSDQAPTWLLFDADWFHTKQAAPYLPRLRKMVSVGRLKWMPGTTMDGKDNCAWYLFDKPSDEITVAYGRAA